MEEKIHEKTENIIIDLINVGAGGRLVIYKPENSAMDLAVEKRGDYKKSPISLKICVQDVLFKDKGFVRKDFDYAGNFYYVFAYFDLIKQDIEDVIWVVYSEDFSGLKETDLLRFSVNKEDIGQFLLNKFGK